jgi:predicted phage-related endonuclease
MHIEHLSEEEWLELHHDPSMISASQVSSILNQNKYCNAFELWLQKLGYREWPDTTMLMIMGHYAEKPIAGRYEQETGRVCMDPGEFSIYRHPEYPWLFSTLDREAKNEDQERGAIECKYTQIKDFWNEFDRGPIEYKIQNQIQMHCADLKWGALVGAVGRTYNEFHIYEAERDDEFFKAAIPKLIEFRRMCMEEEPPDIVEFDQKQFDLMKSLHPDDNGETVAIPEDLVKLAELYTKNNAIIRTLSNQNACFKAQISNFMGDNTFGDCGHDREIKWKTNSAGNRIMTIKVPEIEEQEEYQLEEDNE